MSEQVDRQLRDGLHAHGYARTDDGVLWETYVGEDIVVQCPPSDDADLYFTDLVPRAVFLFSHAAENGVRVPEVLDHGTDSPAYLVLQRIDGPNLSAFVHATADDATRAAALRSAGEVLGQIHTTDGFGYGELVAGEYRQSSHGSWRAFTRGLIEQAVEYTSGGPFEPVVSEIERRFEPGVVPEQPASRLLHGDFSADNVIIDRETRAWAIDFDNALYGDSRYDYIRARDRLTGADPREGTYSKLLHSPDQADPRVLGDSQAESAFKTGYERAHELVIDDELEAQYVLLAMAKSAQDGEWIRQNRAVSTADWVNGLAGWYRSRFG